MWARLRTACGACREVEIQYPPQAQIVVPLRRSFRSMMVAQEIDHTPIQTRTFELDIQGQVDMERMGIHPQHWVLDYNERLP